MGKGIHSELCTETVSINGIQVMPKSATFAPGDVIVSSNSMSPEIIENIIVPTGGVGQYSEIKTTFRRKNINTSPPLVHSESKSSFSDDDLSYFDVVRKQRKVCVPLSMGIDDVPNEDVHRKGILVAHYGQEERQDYLHLVNYLSSQSLITGGEKVCFRMAPNGSNGGGAGGGAYVGGHAGAAMSNSWVLGGGNTYSGYSIGGNGDDDPWKHNRPVNIPSSHYFDNFDTFDSMQDIDKLTADLLRNDIFMELTALDPSIFPNDLAGFEQPSQPTANVFVEMPSDPAPATPITPGVYAPSPASVRSQSVNTPSNSYNGNSDIDDLLTIQSLMNTGNSSSAASLPVKLSINQQPTTPSSARNIHHVYVTPPVTSHVTQVTQPATVSPQASSCTPLPHHGGAHQPHETVDFFKTSVTQTSTDYCIKIMVKNPHDQVGYQALQHCVALYSKYQFALQQQAINQSVAIEAKASLCTMIMNVTGDISFTMPAGCIPLAQWLRSPSNAADIHSLQLILQQVVNSLVLLFQGENNLCFWGSYELFIFPRNKQVYLYIDFTKSLSIQKVYSYSGQLNPQNEDCKVLGELYKLLLKPFLNNSNSTKISPQLADILRTFEQIVTSPNCVHQMAMCARILGQRRICKIAIDVMVDPRMPTSSYLMFCLEHESLSHSIGVLKNTLPSSVDKWIVYHAENSLPASITEIAVRDAHQRFIVLPNDGRPCVPGLLYF